MSYKNNEGYPDPTAGKAVQAAGRMPTYIYNVSCALNAVAGLHGLEIMGLRDKKTGKEALKVRYHLRTPQKNLLANCKHGKQKRLRRSLTAL